MHEVLVRALYSLLLRLATPVYLARLWWRGAREPLYRHDLNQRLAWGAVPGADATTGALWVHAVSLGETRAASALIDALRAEQPRLRLLLTHSTATGRDAGLALLRAGDAQTWLPYDTPGAVRRFFKQHRPAVGVLMETEIWPNLLQAAEEAQVPMVSANARLSHKSFRKGQRLAALLHPALARFAAVLVQTEADAERLRASGARHVQVLGNLKFDLTPQPDMLDRGRAWRVSLQRPVVLAAVTREGEEAQLLQAWRSVSAPRPLLLIVPRHPQRFDAVAKLVTASGCKLARRSDWTEAPSTRALASDGADVWLGDSTGEMALYYGCADVALLGGSFEPLGGQNLIEAAACGCPVVMGPHTFNFAQAAEGALAAGAAQRAGDMTHGVAAAMALLQDPVALQRMGSDAVQFASQHRGAARRMAQVIVALSAASPR